MSKRARLPQSRHHIIIFDEDWEWLNATYGQGTESTLGVSNAIREIVHATILRIKDKANAIIDERRQQNGTDSAE